VKTRFVGILLFFCLVAPIASTYTFLHYQKKRIKKEVKHQIIAGINKDELVLLKFSEKESRSQLKWKHSKEFEYLAQMYDIVATEFKLDTIYYWCWLDNKETTLNKKLKVLAAFAFKQDSKNKENQKRIANFYKSLYYSEGSSWESIHKQSQSLSYFYEFKYQPLYFPPPVPPPVIA
jgi:hypothetical protein